MAAPDRSAGRVNALGSGLPSPCFTGWVAADLPEAQIGLYSLCSYLLAGAEDAVCGCP